MFYPVNTRSHTHSIKKHPVNILILKTEESSCSIFLYLENMSFLLGIKRKGLPVIYDLILDFILWECMEEDIKY